MYRTAKKPCHMPTFEDLSLVNERIGDNVLIEERRSD
jgi:hypothetical protein